MRGKSREHIHPHVLVQKLSALGSVTEKNLPIRVRGVDRWIIGCQRKMRAGYLQVVIRASLFEAGGRKKYLEYARMVNDRDGNADRISEMLDRFGM